MQFSVNDFLSYASGGTVLSTKQTRTRPAPAVRQRTSTPNPAIITRPVSAPVVYNAMPATVQPAKAAIELVNYSPLSFAIFGETKPIKDQLFDLGGKFNNYLKRDGKVVPGFIFSNRRLDAVKAALAL